MKIDDHDDPESAPTLVPEGLTRAPADGPEAELRQVGPYRLLEKLGEGGMGEVWLAEQSTPVRRRVALKLIKAGMDSREVLARFDSERQALALMNHPSIARVYDAGMTSRGRPYFAMEHVAGEPITDYCDRHRVSLRDRLKLFIAACEGVQHAHQKGVIHRDLKPGNVLVSPVEGKPACKIIDFGVAKATQQRLTQHTYHTHIGTLVGTPEYMSPEQAELTGVDVDTRTDVYSLGIILYELMVGALPFEVSRERSLTHEEVRRRIREDEPPLLSSRVTTLGDRASQAAARRGTVPLSLKRQLRGDLDWITHKALEKDRTRRYGSPMELAADVQRHLDDQPVVAGPPSATYRLAKFVRRHRVGVAAVGAIAAALVAGLGLAIWGLVRAQRAEAAAHREAAVAEQVSDFLVGLFKVSDPTRSKGGSVTAREILDRGARDIDTTLSGQPELRARMLHEIGKTYEGLGLFTESEKVVERSWEILRAELGPRDIQTLEVMRTLGMVRSQAGRLAEAEALLREALDLMRESPGPDDPETLQAMSQLGSVLAGAGKLAEAEPLLRESLERRTRILGPDSEELLVTKRSLAGVLLDQGKTKEAEPLYREALEGLRRRFGEDDPRAITTQNDLGTLLFFEGKVSETEPLFREVLERYRRVVGPDHPLTLTAANNLGVVLARLDRLPETESLYRDVLERRRRLLGDDHPDTLYSVHNMGGLMHDLDRLEESERFHREALERRMKVLGEAHPETLESECDLCLTLHDMRRLVDAELLCRRSWEGRRKLLGDDHPDTLDSGVALSVVIVSAGRYAEAEAALRASVDAYRKSLPENDRRRVTAVTGLGKCLARQGKIEEAEPLLREAATQVVARKGSARRGEKATVEELVKLYERQDRLDEAAQWRAKLSRRAS